MAIKENRNPAEGYVRTSHPIQGLPRVVRHITGVNTEGKSVFLSTDTGDHQKELVKKSGLANILYTTREHPVDLNGDADVKYARENEPGITVKGGTVCRMIDFGPGAASPMHRVNSLDYAVVIEGSFKLVLDSGEERLMHRGDVTIQRSTSHQWINVTGGGCLPARVLFVLLDVKDLNVDGAKVDGFLGELGKDYVGLPGHEGGDGTTSNGTEKKIVAENEFMESEF
ncbi:cupin domain-containing protein [Apiospora saccharicola]|uniref:Cupin domain-containing protein n=1 Tax=Apiospora saccharicola TaxID=335842 RepID=A0ABR1V8A8_9PEZI